MYLSLYANEKGEILEHLGIRMLGRSGMDWVVSEEEEMIPLPKGSSLVSMPGHIPVGVNAEEAVSYFNMDPRNRKGTVKAVAALLPQGFTRTLLPASVAPAECGSLPLMGYAAVGLKDDQIYVAAVQSDEHRKWHPTYYNTEGLPQKISVMLKKYPDNRIFRQIARCSLEYGCFTAQNIFYQRWEGGIPTYSACNANCIGCISESHLDVDSPQNRIDFLPTVQEVSEMGIEHLQHARDGIISFGQGCEGEPSLNADRLAPAIEKIRQSTDKGTINMNTNAGYTAGIKQVCDAGMDAMRVTLFSPVEESYNYYHRPKNYHLADVENSIRYAKEKNLRVSLNLLVFPGFTDREDQLETLIEWTQKLHIDMIQMRNLNMDPDLLFAGLPEGGESLGMVSFLNILQAEMPELDIGSYTWPVR
ncbi:MAG: radical SAM protein [Bacillota bacterium]|nr:radical SAM protein [Bacillota bacterium]